MHNLRNLWVAVYSFVTFNPGLGQYTSLIRYCTVVAMWIDIRGLTELGL